MCQWHSPDFLFLVISRSTSVHFWRRSSWIVHPSFLTQGPRRGNVSRPCLIGLNLTLGLFRWYLILVRTTNWLTKRASQYSEIISFPRLLFTAVYSFSIWIELSCEAIWRKLETSIAISPLCTGGPNMESQSSSIIHVPQFSPKTTFLIFFLHLVAKSDKSVVSNNAFKTKLMSVSS